MTKRLTERSLKATVLALALGLSAQAAANSTVTRMRTARW